VNRLRGILMLVAAGVAFYEAWRIHHGERVLVACSLGLAALGIALWHLTRKPPRLRS